MRKISIAILCSIIIIVLLIGTLSGCGDGQTASSSFDKAKIHTNVVEANTSFAFDIFQRLNVEDKGKNIFISPLSISTALSMTYQGAAGETKDAMSKALSYEGIDMEALNESYKNLVRYLRQVDSKVKLNISNSIWIREGLPVKESFLSVNKDVFDAYIASLDFSQSDAADRINKWISDSTNAKIKKMIDPPIPQDVVMYLINAIYFKGIWTQQFDKKRTVKSVFHADNGVDKEVMMMNRKDEVEYGKGKDFSTVRLPYGKGKISMYCILPAEGVSIDEFIKNMNLEKWKGIKTSIEKVKDVILQIPRFKLEYGIKLLNDVLTAMGMGEAFTDSADFSGICKGIFISEVLHKAVIEVNEEGSEAAGATVVIMTKTALPEQIIFIADRPFLFIIADNETGTILFMGKLSDID